MLIEEALRGVASNWAVLDLTNMYVLEAFRLVFLFVSYYSLSLMVKHGLTRVNYTRKAVHFAHILSPLLINRAFLDYSLDYFVKSSALSLFFPLLFVEPVRRRVPLLETLFLCFDRPEDRPHTVKLAFTQLLAMNTVIIGLAYLYRFSGLSLDLLAVPLMITAFGDGLAEPVGVKYGKNKYEVTALFTNRVYSRSYEGSAMVLLATVFTLIGLRALFTAPQLLLLLIYMPLKMTIVEAYSPHTFDNPFLYFVGGMIVYLVKIFL